MSTTSEPHIVTHMPKLTKLSPGDWLTDDGPVLINSIRRVLAAAQRPEDAVSTFNNFPRPPLG